ncbi:microtubule-associated protein RP/EB family member 1-like [Scaptodrosophila lebanonensis]|uniref:Microtubule-associated protein RP/EB family member 1-like n=1 Tax=Drosophila lebanonensis TaxID=7225 RepID=A0A6J2U1D6_DROLE|nr:microtubule-associated protein RP/EB family member 1-like [Scaptodrosophila lebanonensis]
MAVNVRGGKCNLSRSELIDWLNGRLMSYYTEVEELADGAAYCQLMDMLFPQAMLSMRRVKFGTLLPRNYIHNYRLLGDAFQKMLVDRELPVQRLVEGYLVDHWLFLQWFKCFFDANYTGRPYDALAERNGRAMGDKNHRKHIRGIYRELGAPVMDYKKETFLKTITNASSIMNQNSPLRNAPLDQIVQELEVKTQSMRVELIDIECKRNICFQGILGIEKLCIELNKDLKSKQLAQSILQLISGFGSREGGTMTKYADEDRNDGDGDGAIVHWKENDTYKNLKKSS